MVTSGPVPTIRSAGTDDLAGIQAIEWEQFSHLAYPYFVLRQLFELHGTDWTVAEFEGRVCGYVLTAISAERCAWFLGFAVAGHCRGRGFGRNLLEAALEHCRKARADRVFVTVRPDNRTAYRLYEDVGFVRSDHEAAYFGRDEPRDVLVHKLYHC
ncbi:GNAT family N-acetyltransferase [Nocardia sp. NPDC050406]|uniref:GNAT family N-acetyltransferase n=1 Tax=Nocardia sp. NPDC050406 TaxID=3364318 RepID=UPI0037A29310